MKMIVVRSSDKVIGLHMVGSEAAEIIQGMAVALRAGASKAIFDTTIGIHPTACRSNSLLSIWQIMPGWIYKRSGRVYLN